MTAYPLIHRAVARQARERPEDVAVVFREERITYRVLDAAASGYAAELVARGVRPGDVVPVRLPRSPRMIAALLAVLKCGAAYAAFDHRWPGERVAGLLERLAAPVFVSDDAAPDGTAVWSPPGGPLESVAAAVVDDGGIGDAAAACVFFTSGTTGVPKGVVSPHRATTRLFGAGGLSGFRPGAVCAQAAPCAWDAFSLELWGMLTTGGTAVVVEEDYLLPGALRDLVKGEGVDTAFLTASLFNLFVDMDVECFTGMRQVYAGGERLSAPHVRRFLAAHPGVGLFNGYGPVESCVFATVHPIGAADCEAPGGIPVGSPVAATEVYVLDAADRCQPPGAEGEICVGGAGLALGYLGLPELTAEKFAVVDVAGAPRRVYRTGDVGFLDADGVAHYRGRADRQVKVRGYRIEPGEIENAALGLDGVRLCAVVPVPGRTVAWERLALFYVADLPADAPDAGGDPLDVAGRLAAVLPPYLVPDAVVRVEGFPVSANGKTDTKALLAALPE